MGEKDPYQQIKDLERSIEASKVALGEIRKSIGDIDRRLKIKPLTQRRLKGKSPAGSN